jgi:hypothetical protein
MSRQKSWLQQTELIITLAAVLVVLLAYAISRFSGS